MLERRYSTATRSEVRSESDKPDVIFGRAATYDVWTVLYKTRLSVVRERINKGAFANALKEKQDVRALFNHDANFVLGRSTSGTLRLDDGDDGLGYEIDPPDSQTVRDLVLTPMKRGDISGSSFAFSIRSGGEKWTEYEGKDGLDYYDRDVNDADLYDVSPVTFPAYDESTSGVRNGLSPELRARIERREAAKSRRPAPLRTRYRQWLDGNGALPADGAKSATGPERIVK